MKPRTTCVWVLPVAVLTLAGPAFASQVLRSQGNSSLSNIFWVNGVTAGRSKQIFVNPLDRIDSVDLDLNNWGTATTDVITIRIGHACLGGTSWQVSSTRTINLPGAKPAFVNVPIPGGVNVNYGEYYVIEVSAQRSDVAFNSDQYLSGRRVNPDLTNHTDLLRFPAKKEDLWFVLNGVVESTKFWDPNPTTNVACPAKCVSVYPENVSGGARQSFNVLVQEYRTDTGVWNGTVQPGSFWGEDVNYLKAQVRTMVEGTPGFPELGLKNRYPYGNWITANKANFYIALENPATDPQFYRGFFYCANIDASVQVAGLGGIAYIGGFSGWLGRGNPPVPNWGGNLMGQAPHEVFGHGFGLMDEYEINTVETDQGGFQSFALNSVPIGCADPASGNWCSSYIDVNQLKGRMASNNDPFNVCWSRPNTLAGCEVDEQPGTPGMQSKCHFLGKYGGTVSPYYGTYRCVPKTIVNYNIGNNCSCYIGGGTNNPDLHVAQPHALVMASMHGCNPLEATIPHCDPNFNPPTPGYHPGVASQLNTLMNCVFPTSCASYDYTSCAAFQSTWGTAGNGYLNFLSSANACAAGGANKRR
jgi:hypothetical protein